VLRTRLVVSLSTATMTIGDGQASTPRWRSHRGGREFLALLAAQTISDAGSQATTVALPLLTLLLTGSAFQAGLVGFARSLAYPLAALPSGVVADRFDRRRVLIVSGLGRALAMASVLLTLATGEPAIVQLALVAFVDSALWSLGQTAERGVFRALVPTRDLPRAIALSEGRTAAAAIAGPPLGGALLAAARALPFALDALSTLPLLAVVAGIRTSLTPPASGRRTQAGVRAAINHALEGLRWLWARPFLRAGALLYAAANLTLGALDLLVILVAKHYGAGAGAIGLMFAVMGFGGVIGSMLAGRASGWLSARSSIALEPWVGLAVIPLLLVLHSPLAIGLLGAAYFISIPLSAATLHSRRVAFTPDELQGRVQAGAGLISSSLAWLGPLAVGAVFSAAGATAAVLMVTGWALVVVIGISLSASLRHPPPLENATVQD
jgi:MFS family permease